VRVIKLGKLVDLDAVEGDDEFLVFAEGDLVGCSSGFALFANTFAKVERDAAGGSFHLGPKVPLATRKLGDDPVYCAIQV